MAFLVDAHGVSVLLLPHHTIGRSADNELVLDSGRVSSRHALIRWTEAGWFMRDLGSRNGTSVNGRRLVAGQEAALGTGDALVFADVEGWSIGDTAPPGAMAVPLHGGEPVVAQGRLLALPDDERPVVTLLRADDGWVIERPDAAAEPARDGQRVTAAGQVWRLSLPELVHQTQEMTVSSRLTDLVMSFRVSRDEEHVELTSILPTGTARLRSRVHHYTLLTLARLRLADRASDIPVGERGWVVQERLERMLRLDRNTLYQHIHRARRELDALGVSDAEHVIQRRLDTGQLRLGVGQIEVREATRS